MTLLDRIILLLTGLVAAYLTWRLYTRYAKQNKLHDLYYMMGFVVLLVSGVLLIFRGYGILGSTFVLTVATLIPLGIAMGLMNQFLPAFKKYFSWFALVGLLAIALTSATGSPLKKLAVPVFHGVAGLIIILIPIWASRGGKASNGFWWVGVGGVLISLGGIALAFLSTGAQLLFFSAEFVFMILAPLLLLMALAFSYGFMKDIAAKG
jgi:hypothetical protein